MAELPFSLKIEVMAYFTKFKSFELLMKIMQTVKYFKKYFTIFPEVKDNKYFRSHFKKTLFLFLHKYSKLKPSLSFTWNSCCTSKVSTSDYY